MTSRKALAVLALTSTLLCCTKNRIDLVQAIDGGASDDALADTAAALIPSSPTAVRVGWLSPAGIPALSQHYGFAVQSGSNPERFGVPGATLYKQNLALMKPGLVNVMSVDLMADSSTAAAGWLMSPNTQAFAWDREKIRRSLAGGVAMNAEFMLTIPTWPQALGPQNVALDPANYQRFALLCADLVRVLNVEHQRGVRLFQIFSEPEPWFKDGATLGRLVATVAREMKAIDASIQVGGVGFIEGDSPMLPTFVAEAADNLDFVSFHGYGTSDVQEPLPFVFANADLLGRYAEGIRALGVGRARPVGVYQTQWALNWQQDRRMAGQAAAVFDVLAMISFVKYRLTGAAGWKDADGWYGKMDELDQLRPAAHAMALMNRAFVGEVVATTSPSADITAFAVRAGGKRSLLLVNRSAAPIATQVEVWNGTPFSAAAVRTTVDDAGSSSTGASMVQGQRIFVVQLPALSITAFED